MVAPIAVAAVTAAISLGSAMQGAQAATEAGKRAAELERMTTTENLRRMDLQYGKLRGNAVAAMAASGVVRTHDDSTNKVLADMDQEHADQQSWMRRAGHSRARTLEKGGQVQGTQLIGQGLGGAMNSFKGAGESQDWWS